MAQGEFPARPASIKQAAAKVGVHPDTIRSRIKFGELTCYRFGERILRVDLDELESLYTPIPTVKNSGAT